MYSQGGHQANQFQQQQQQQQQFASPAPNQQTFASAPPQQQQQGGNDSAGNTVRSMYGQSSVLTGAGGGGGNQPQQWANGGGQAIQGYGQMGGGYGQNGQQYTTQANPGQSTTTSLFQQQLAHQQQASMTPSSHQPHAGGNNYQASAQAYMQSQQQLAQARQQQQQQQNSAPSPYSNSHPPASQYPPSQPSPNQPRPTPPQNMSNQEIMSHLQGINMQAMNHQLYNSLTPIQQTAAREYMQRTRTHQAQQQAQLGIGLPGSSAPSTASNPHKPPVANNASPAPTATPFQRPQQDSQASQTPSGSSLNFLKALSEFYQRRGIVYNGPPVIEGRSVDLGRLYAAVAHAGGFNATNTNRLWGSIASSLGFPASSPNDHPESRLQELAKSYYEMLFAFEQALAQLAQNRQLQAARQRPPGTPVANGVPSPFAQPPTAIATPSQPSESHASPAQPFSSMPSQTAPSATPPTSAVPTRPTSSAGPGTATQAFGPRPVTGSSQRNGSGTFAGVQDLKGKGRATEEPSDSIKAEDFASNGTSASAVNSSSTPKNRLQPPLPIDLATSSTPLRPDLANPSKISSMQQPVPPPPDQPARRKRQKIEYVPFSKTHDSVAGYDLAAVEEVVEQATKRKRPRTAYDLGLVDLHSLTMSLRSRLASEVSFALNSLTLISMSIRSQPSETGVNSFPIARCGGLYEELVDLLEETAYGFGEEDEERENEGEEEGTEGGSKGKEGDQETYRTLFRTIVEEAGEMVPLDDDDDRSRIAKLADEGLTPLRPSDILLSILNILRNFSLADENAVWMGRDRNLLDVLLKISNLPLKRPGSTETSRWPIRITPLDSMAIKKDILELILSFGLEVRLDEQSPRTAHHLFDLFAFFLLDAHHRDQPHFDLSSVPGTASRIVQPPSVRIARYVDLALAAFARVALFDVNRTVISRLAPSPTLERLFDSMIQLFPITEQDFQVMTFEAGLIHVENLAMSIYNLAYLAPPELKLSLRSKPGYVKCLLRIVRRLSGSASDSAATLAFQPLTERCIATLQLLSSLEGVTVGSTGIESSEVPWWGMSMSGWEIDDEAAGGEGGKPYIRPAQPNELDRASVKQRLPPSASTAAGLDPGPPVLAAETRALFESLSNGSLVNIFGSLVGLM